MTSFAVLLLLCFLVDISSWRLSVFTAKTVSQSDHAPVRRRPSFGEVAPDCTDTRYRDSQGIRGRGLDIVAIASALVLSCMVDSSIAALPNTFNYEQGKLGFDYTEDLQRSSKPVKTHAVEVFFKSKGFKGFNVGVTVDPVKLNNIRDFSTPEGLAQKVYNIEKEKEGVFDVQIISSKETTVNKISMEDNTVVASIPSYLIDYKIDSSRGKNHYLVKSTIVNKQLYVMTAQCKEADFPALETTEKEIIDSFRLLQ